MGRNSLAMNDFEYEFMTGWKGPKGAAFNACYEFCRNFGWIEGFHDNGKPNWTPAGRQAVKAYQASENNKRVDVI